MLISPLPLDAIDDEVSDKVWGKAIDYTNMRLANSNVVTDMLPIAKWLSDWDDVDTLHFLYNPQGYANDIADAIFHQTIENIPDNEGDIDGAFNDAIYGDNSPTKF